MFSFLIAKREEKLLDRILVLFAVLVSIYFLFFFKLSVNVDSFSFLFFLLFLVFSGFLFFFQHGSDVLQPLKGPLTIFVASNI
jgi:hypothetical protein